MSNGPLSPTNVGHIGVPQSSQNAINQNEKLINEQNKSTAIKEARIQFATWFMGFLISLFPLLLLPIIKILDGNKFCDSFSGFFANPELYFIGISIAISAVNDFINNSKNFIDTLWFQVNLALILLGSIIYALFVVRAYYNPNANNVTCFTVFTILYLVITLTLGCIRYIKNIKEKREG